MGTNYYFISKNKQAMNEWFGEFKYQLIDTPYFGYEAHVAKTSMGWLPLFQGYKNIKSVNDLKKCYDTGAFKIFDEYEDEYNWEEFKERVIEHNGGYLGAIERRKVESTYGDLPNYRPISHFEVEDANAYFKDDKGYEFYPDDFL